MESLDTIKKLWQASEAPQTNSGLLTQAYIEKMIKPRVRKEQNTVMQYFWASFVYQILIYAFASHVIIRFWGNTQIMLLSLAGILLYLPFTIMLMRKFKAMACLPIHQPGMPVPDVYRNVQTKHALLTQFYRFKRRFDWVAVPLSCLIIVVVLFKLYVDGGITAHPTGGIITYLSILALFVAATYAENRKRFKIPIRQLKLIMQDLKR